MVRPRFQYFRNNNGIRDIGTIIAVDGAFGVFVCEVPQKWVGKEEKIRKRGVKSHYVDELVVERSKEGKLNRRCVCLAMISYRTIYI